MIASPLRSLFTSTVNLFMQLLKQLIQQLTSTQNKQLIANKTSQGF